MNLLFRVPRPCFLSFCSSSTRGARLLRHTANCSVADRRPPQSRLWPGYPYTRGVGHITNAVRARTSTGRRLSQPVPRRRRNGLSAQVGNELASGYERPDHTAAVSGSRPPTRYTARSLSRSQPDARLVTQIVFMIHRRRRPMDPFPSPRPTKLERHTIGTHSRKKTDMQDRNLFSHRELSHSDDSHKAAPSGDIPQPVFSDLVIDPKATRQEAQSTSVSDRG